MGHYNSETKAVRKKGHHKGHYENHPGAGSKEKRIDKKKYPRLGQAINAAKYTSATGKAPKDQDEALSRVMKGN